MRRSLTVTLFCLFTFFGFFPEMVSAQETEWRNYFARRTTELETACLKQKPEGQSWQDYQKQLRSELFDMLGLWPIPEKSDLAAQITGSHEKNGVIAENIVFQSRPGLYVTANLYRPSKADKPLPGVIYVCGHGEVKKDGVAFGNKTHYQHHGAWFARNGYVCLTIDTVQLGEIEGIHHGTFRMDMWWWLNRGYTPAGVEAWNAIRAVDYLVSRPEVDGEKLAVTGRSGGGAYSWWLAALDERIDCAIPVAGITDLRDHVVDDCVEGHCDCMYFVNKFGWDYPAVAALVAPRALLISNTDRDPIFPLEGVGRIHQRVRDVYQDLGKQTLLGLNITAGEHVDTQELQVHALRWMNSHLKNDKTPIPNAAEKLFTIEELKVFNEIPTDQRNTSVQEWFVPQAKPALPPLSLAERSDWKKTHYSGLRSGPFRCWPNEPQSKDLKLVGTFKHRLVDQQPSQFSTWTWSPDPAFELPIYVIGEEAMTDKSTVQIRVVNESDYAMLKPLIEQINDGCKNPAQETTLSEESLKALKTLSANNPSNNQAIALVVPRGIGPNRWPGDKKTYTHFQRRLYLLGETLDALQVFDIASALKTLRSQPAFSNCAIDVYADGVMRVNTSYAAAISEVPCQLKIESLPESFRDGPYYLNIERQY